MLWKRILALLLSCTLLASFVLTASAQRQEQDGADVQQAEQALEDYDLTDFDDIRIDGPLDADEVTIGGSGVQADTPSTYSAGQFTTPTFLWNDSLTADDPTDFYFFSLADSRDIWFNIASSNTNTVVMFCLVDWASGSINPTNIYTNAGAGMTGVRGVPAGDYALYVLTADNSASTYQVMYNGTTVPGATGLIHYTDDLSMMVFRYSPEIIRYNGKAFNIKSEIHYSAAEEWRTVGDGWEYHTYDLKGTVPDAAVLGSFQSTLSSSKLVIYYQLPEGTTFSTRGRRQDKYGLTIWSSEYDLRNLFTPRKLDYLDVQSSNPEFETYGPQYVVYDLLAEKFIAFPSKLNIAYFTGGQKVDRKNSKMYAILYGTPQQAQ